MFGLAYIDVQGNFHPKWPRQKRLNQKQKNLATTALPSINQIILFRNKESEEWVWGTIIKSFKNTSKYRNSRHVELKGGGQRCK